MLQKRNTPVLRFRNLIFKDVLGVLEDWGFDHIKCFTFITQIREGHKISLKIRITGSNGLTMMSHRHTSTVLARVVPELAQDGTAGCDSSLLICMFCSASFFFRVLDRVRGYYLLVT